LTGAVVASTYKALREEARGLAIARNKLLEEATQAYLRGAKDVAKNLSLSGHNINERMKECHAQVCNVFCIAKPHHIVYIL
jgi:hypothetical protein